MNLIADSQSNQVNQPHSSKESSLKYHKRRALELYQDGFNYKDIAEKLEFEGYRNRKNNPFSVTSIRKWIKDNN
ncbi:recombinase family protein [Dapis sp. BLCC M126]|uniref:recombinase family protein n=1 Tax=Dapis sp. BLCC M126 TaxID=3400189 RepID=UPI003CF11B1E